jgi:hypothetical protein
MGLFRKIVVLAGAAEVARRYARSNPEKAGRFVDQAAGFVDKQTKGKYSGQIDGAVQKAKGAAGIPAPGSTGVPSPEQGTGYGQPLGSPPATGQPGGTPPGDGRPYPATPEGRPGT